MVSLLDVLYKGSFQVHTILTAIYFDTYFDKCNLSVQILCGAVFKVVNHVGRAHGKYMWCPESAMFSYGTAVRAIAFTA